MTLKFLHINEFKKVVNVQAHIHCVYELIYYINAKGKSKYASQRQKSLESKFISYIDHVNLDKTFNFSNNTCVIFPNGYIHNEIHETSSTVIAIGFDPDDISIENPVLFKDNDLSVFSTIQKLIQEYKNKNVLYTKIIESYLTAILVKILRNNNNIQNIDTHAPIEYAQEYINEYYTTNINLVKLAKYAGYSSSRFRALFKKHVGISPKNYIISKRIKHAKKLLLTTDYSINHIAELCGYSDYPQFNKSFNLHTGLNPKTYRKKFKS